MKVGAEGVASHNKSEGKEGDAGLGKIMSKLILRCGKRVLVMIGKGLLKREHLILGFPILLVVLVFWQVHRFDSILYDDPSYLYENPLVSSGLSLRGMEWAFTEAGATNLWHPVTWISMMLDVEVFGLKNVGAHHLVNVAFHLVAVVLFYFIFLHYFKNPWLALFLLLPLGHSSPSNPERGLDQRA